MFVNVPVQIKAIPVFVPSSGAAWRPLLRRTLQGSGHGATHFTALVNPCRKNENGSLVHLSFSPYLCGNF